LITGGTRGIGRAIAERLAISEFDVTLVYRANDAEADRALRQLRDLGAAAFALRANVTDEDDVAWAVEETERRGGVDLLVNNVGDFLFRPFLETSLDEWRRILESNLMTTVICCRAVVPGMRRRRCGTIVNIATMHAGRGRAVPNTLPYAIAKAGIVQLTRTLARTEGPYGIRVNAVCPGFVDGAEHPPAAGPESVPLKRWARPEEIADAVCYLSSDRAAYITGAVLDVHGGALL